MELEVIQVSVGTPGSLGKRKDKKGQLREVVSGIQKQRLSTPQITVTHDGIVGDEQADKRVVRGERIHGGQFQAIYAYPLAHLERWATELGTSREPGTFGENLTIVGATEEDVRIGDVFAWGNRVTLRVTKPRRPCYKLPMHLGVPDVAELMKQNGRCGWYFEVLEVGVVRAGASLELMFRRSKGQTVAAAFAAKVRADPTIPDMPDH